MTTLSRTAIRRMLAEAYRQTCRVGDEIYYPAKWRFPGAGPGCTTSEPVAEMSCRRSAQGARREIAMGHVADELGVEVDPRRYGEVRTLPDAALEIAASLAGPVLG